MTFNDADLSCFCLFRNEFNQWLAMERKRSKFERHMRDFAKAAWATMEAMHQLFLVDEQPENEKARMDPDHW